MEEKEEQMNATTDPTNPAVATDPAAAAVVADVVTPTSTSDALTAKLTELNVSPEFIKKIRDELGAETVEDLGELTADSLAQIGMKKIPASKLLKALAPTPVVAAAPTMNPAATVGFAGNVSYEHLLPTVPDNVSWLRALCAGGVLKVDETTVISAVRVALAQKVGLFSILDRLVVLMEQFAEESEEQVDADFFKMRAKIVRNNYAELFSTIEGMDGRYVTEARKKKLLGRIEQYFWPAVVEFQQQLKAWETTWSQGMANPMMGIASFLSMNNMGPGVAMPPGLMQPPDTGILRDCADAVADATNKVFAGTGVQIVSAMAYDASQISETLSNPKLHILVGAPNREQMLRKLNASIPAIYPRLEANLSQFVLSILQAKDQTAGTDEARYFGGMCMLSNQINLSQLTDMGSNSSSNTGLTPIGGRPQSARRGTGRDDL